MSHFSVIVCIDDLAKLEAVMAPFSEQLEVEPYRDYEEGGPAGYWAVKALRENAGLNPDDSALTWAQVADAHNRRYAPSYAEAGLLRDGQERPLLVDEESGRAYTMSTYNPESKWDYWRIGGRWGGYFPFRAEYREQVIQPEPGWDSPESIPPDHCDGGPKLALDLAALREEKAAQARKTYAEFHALVDGTPEAMPWSAFADNVSDGNGYTIERAREEYRSQPRVKVIKDSDFRWHDDPVAEFGQPERQYVAKETAGAVPGYATVTLDGRWMAPGRMGWFGMSTETESDQIGYWEAANAYIEALPETTLLVALDCHI
jgi:hypothetical protein